jgi:hypothetical protein
MARRTTVDNGEDCVEAHRSVGLPLELPDLPGERRRESGTRRLDDDPIGVEASVGRNACQPFQLEKMRKEEKKRKERGLTSP